MYQLTDEQIAFIENDIRARGLTMEELQDDLLDHICCVVERDMGEGKNFEACYVRMIRKFYHMILKTEPIIKAIAVNRPLSIISFLIS